MAIDRLAHLALAGALLSGCGAMGESSSRADKLVDAPFLGPVPRASCGPGSMPETGLQGQVPLEDRQSGRSQFGYSCNLERVGQAQEAGAGWSHAWFDDCAYFNQTLSIRPNLTPGVVVIDAADPSQPRASARLTSPAMLDPHESLKVNERSALLAGVAGPDPAGNGPLFFDVYDLSADCAQPQQKASVTLNLADGHEGEFNTDGTIFYGSGFGGITAIDLKDAANPVVITRLTSISHGLSTSEDGTRLYTNGPSLVGPSQILDVSQVESRSTEPLFDPPVIASGFTGNSQMSQAVTIGGKPFLLMANEGTPPASLLDLSDESNPRLAADLSLEIHMPENSDAAAADNPPGYDNGFFGYLGHYCQADDPRDTQAVACGEFQSGIRVFDVRDPFQPKEIAYYNPPAQVGKNSQLMGSDHANSAVSATSNLTTDWCTAKVRFVRERGELWTTCQDNGFMVLKFTNGVWPFAD